MTAVQFAVFSFLFAFATCAYHAQIVLPLDFDLHTLALIAALAVLSKPSSMVRFLVLAAVQTTAIYVQMPAINTNRMVVFFVGATTLVGVALHMATTRSLRLDPQEFIATIAPALRLEVLIVYGFTFWHKLNYDFFDPARSCGIALYGQLQDALPLLPSIEQGSWLGPTVICATLLVEGAIPLALLLRSTRTAGAVAACCFHVVLGLGGFYSFSATMVALLSLFVPAESVDVAFGGWKGRRYTVAVITLTLALSSAAFIASKWDAAFPALDNLNRVWAEECDVLFWRASFLIPIGLAWFLLRLRRSRGIQPSVRDAELRMHPALAALAVCVFLNGMCPYLGLKTETAFAMYSNLRTEGGATNHVLIPRPLALADYQVDLVRILRAPDDELEQVKREDRPIPFIELRRHVCDLIARGDKYINVTYVRGGVIQRVVHAESSPELAAPLNYFERKFLVFRRILLGDANVCEH